jgi:hypothetical protein
MTNVSLAQAYLVKAKARLRVLEVLMEERAYSDVIREAQEAVFHRRGSRERRVLKLRVLRVLCGGATGHWPLTTDY